MRTLPTVRVLSPADHVAASALFDLTMEEGGVNYLRFDAQPLPVLYAESTVSLRRGFVVHSSGADVTLVATGYMTHIALQVASVLRAENLSVGVVDMVDLSRFDNTLLLSELLRTRAVVSLEEGFSGKGGLDSALLSLFAREKLGLNNFLAIGVPSEYRFELGTREALHEQVGIGQNAVCQRIRNFLNSR